MGDLGDGNCILRTFPPTISLLSTYSSSCSVAITVYSFLCSDSLRGGRIPSSLILGGTRGTLLWCNLLSRVLYCVLAFENHAVESRKRRGLAMASQARREIPLNLRIPRAQSISRQCLLHTPWWVHSSLTCLMSYISPGTETRSSSTGYEGYIVSRIVAGYGK